MILKPRDLKLGDVVCYMSAARSPFGDMEVVKVEGSERILRRPYINGRGEAAYEELWWSEGSNFDFLLVRRD